MDEKKNRIQVITLVLCMLLLGLNLWQLRRISDLQGQLARTESNLQTETRRLDERIQSIQRTAAEADLLVQDWTYTSSVNRETRSLDVAVSVTLKEWREDTAAELLWTNENGNGEGDGVPLSGDGTGVFTGTMELPLTGLSGENTLDVKIINGGTQRRENLGYLGDTSMLLPVQIYSYGIVGPTLETRASRPGAVTVSDCDVNLEGFRGESLPDLSGQVFRLRRNGEIAAEETAMYGETIGHYTSEKMSVEVQPGDELELTFFCRDNSGLGYEFSLRSWTVNESGVGEQASPEESWPRLTWD